MSEYQQASIEHLKYSQNGGALRARFRNSLHGIWMNGWLVGWVQDDNPWVCCWNAPDDFEFRYDESDYYQYCEILTSDLEAR